MDARLAAKAFRDKTRGEVVFACLVARVAAADVAADEWAEVGQIFPGWEAIGKLW